jgi:glycosyltransferase involved in cell wall biosynthesis
MSVLSQDPGQFTGTGTYVRELIRELGRRQGEIVLEVLCNEHAAARLRGWAPPTVQIKLARGYRAGSTRATRLAAMAGAAVLPRRLARQLSPTLQVIHYPLTSNLPPVPAATVTTLHDVQHHELPELFGPVHRVWRRFAYDRAAARSTIVITDSHHARKRIIELLGVDPERVVTIHLAVDHGRFRAEASSGEDELLAPFNLPERFVLYPASLWPHKNHERLLEALSRVEDRSLHLVLTGAAFGHLAELGARASRLGVGERVHHLGFVPDPVLPPLYRRARALVFPSRYEGFGAPPLEAMACGCPVASSMAASLAEVCDDAAEPLDPDDPTQMAAAIGRVADDEPTRARLRDRGLENARRFSWAASAAAHVSAYRRAIELRQGSATLRRASHHN